MKKEQEVKVVKCGLAYAVGDFLTVVGGCMAAIVLAKLLGII